MTRDAPQHMRQPTASLHHVAFSTAKLLVLAGTTALHGDPWGGHPCNCKLQFCMIHLHVYVLLQTLCCNSCILEEASSSNRGNHRCWDTRSCLIMVLRIAGDMVNSLQHTAGFSAKLLQFAGTTVLPKEGIHFLLAAELHNTYACICASTYALF